ncbi:hypothetical protein [Krasilnikovia sp. M28-CT-15]|uniref:hypothetical protein n=1 Tax=Krasilnikovia sp. M28-CT-15 TaxID=3373540 RepID=UPI003876E70E
MPSRTFIHQTRSAVAVLVCTAVSDLAVAVVAIINPEVAPIALGAIVTLTTAGVAAVVPPARPTAS